MNAKKTLIEIATKRGLNMTELAARIGYNDSTVRGWKKGVVPPYRVILDIRQRLPLTNEEFSALLSACQADVLEHWRSR